MTERQRLAWGEHILKPSRADMYAAQTAMMVNCAWGGKTAPKLEDYVLKAPAAVRRLSVEEETILAKLRWEPALMRKPDGSHRRRS